MSRQSLRFTVHRARSDADLHAACEVRVASYGHHLPNVTSVWREPDALDRDRDTAVFLACDKATGQPVGTVRLTTNARTPTQIERHARVPSAIAERLVAEVTRLAVRPGHDDPTVKLGLMKASYLYCLANQVRWMVIGARSEALVRGYRRLGFTDVADGESVPLAHAANLPHRLLAFDVTAAERNWHALNHPFYEFMVRSYHADIDLTEPRYADAA